MTTTTFGPGFLERVTLNTARTGDTITVTARGTVPLDCGRATHHVDIDQVTPYPIADADSDMAAKLHSGDPQYDLVSLADELAFELVDQATEDWTCDCG